MVCYEGVVISSSLPCIISRRDRRPKAMPNWITIDSRRQWAWPCIFAFSFLRGISFRVQLHHLSMYMLELERLYITRWTCFFREDCAGYWPPQNCLCSLVGRVSTGSFRVKSRGSCPCSCNTNPRVIQPSTKSGEKCI